MTHTVLWRRAFTLVEMVVVVAIILIILGFALPAAQTMKPLTFLLICGKILTWQR